MRYSILVIFLIGFLIFMFCCGVPEEKLKVNGKEDFELEELKTKRPDVRGQEE